MAESHSILGGKVRVYKRSSSSVWQCHTYVNRKKMRTSTREKSLARAKEFAEDWYLELRVKVRRGEIKNEKTFADAAKLFTTQYAVMTAGERNERYVQNHQGRLNNHLLPFFGTKGLSEITPGLLQEYRVLRRTPDENGKVPAHSTLNQEIVVLRQVMKTALREGWIGHLPDFSTPYQLSRKVTHRAWFSPEDYKKLYQATRRNAKAAQGKKWQWAAEQMHDYVLFMANTGLRPDEANNLEYRDVSIEQDGGQTILVIEVRGKRGVGYCKSTAGAVHPFKRMVERNTPAPTDKLFPAYHRKGFNRILEEEGLKYDRQGNRRTAYSLRHTYICLRLLEGADIYQVAKNCRTSVEMIEKHYAAHIKTQLNASAINVRKRVSKNDG
ncbi:tyrosine-type recombinase/integrase [Rhodobium gokarnense]|uniref:Integrase n=1 Tax=Rhodobium gokarnense TaxID=364296 RepID=A0ABT3HAG9_9HYPH|nr:site-specific integrase [Rhodobium gokarnense]MCW2307388.1 integrase [Rhodobium gokarnense]